MEPIPLCKGGGARCHDKIILTIIYILKCMLNDFELAHVWMYTKGWDNLESQILNTQEERGVLFGSQYFSRVKPSFRLSSFPIVHNLRGWCVCSVNRNQ